MSITLNYENILAELNYEFNKIKETGSYGLKVIVEDEQAWIKRGSVNGDLRKTIFIVVRFGGASVNYASSVTPVTMMVMGLSNEIKITQQFLNDFSATYGTSVRMTDNPNVVQVFSTPSVLSNFNDKEATFTSLFAISGTLLIGVDSVYVGSVKYVYGTGTTDFEYIDFLSYNDSTNNSLNTQLYGNTIRTKSYTTAQTFTFSIAIYSINSQLVKDVMDVKYGNTDLSNKEFDLSVLFSNTKGFSNWKFKLTHAEYTQKLGEMPVLSLAFTL